MGRKAPRKRLACRVMCRPKGCSAEHPNVSRRSAHPSIRVSEAKLQNPGRKTAPREREDLGCLKSEEGYERVRGLCVPDAVQRVTKWSGAALIRDRQRLRRFRVCSASCRCASCCAAPGTRELPRRTAASCEEPTFTCGRIHSIVSGLLFTMKIATRTTIT
jgi:hypothetical protein